VEAERVDERLILHCVFARCDCDGLFVRLSNEYG
jgi:hypothetical protein